MSLTMTSPFMAIIGIGEQGFSALSEKAHQKINHADILIGGQRHLAMLPALVKGKKIEWTSPFCKNFDVIDSLQEKNLVILASGDPMHYGIGATLIKHYGEKKFTIIPAPSAFSLAAASLGWPLQHVTMMSLHGRNLTKLKIFLQPERKILTLTSNGESVHKIASYLCDNGFGNSVFHILERLGHQKEQCHSFSAVQLLPKDQIFSNLNIVAIICKPDYEKNWHSLFTVLPDDAFIHDGQLTKSEIRGATLAWLKPFPDALLWDIGAGNGSIAIEWMRAGGKAIAVEKNPDRCQNITQNAKNLGIPDLEIKQGNAMDVIQHLPSNPAAVFIGGGLSMALCDLCMQSLPMGGRLVINVVTIESELLLFKIFEKNGGDLRRINVSHLQKTGTLHSFKPLMPVTQYIWRAPPKPTPRAYLARAAQANPEHTFSAHSPSNSARTFSAHNPSNSARTFSACNPSNSARTFSARNPSNPARIIEK